MEIILPCHPIIFLVYYKKNNDKPYQTSFDGVEAAKFMSRFREDDNDDRNTKGNFAEINIDVGSIFIGVTLNKGGTVIMRKNHLIMGSYRS